MMNKITINNQDFTVEQLEAMIQEAKKSKLKYPNGAELYAPENGTEYYSIRDYANYIDRYQWDGDGTCLYRLNNQLVFLEKKIAERYLNYLNTHQKFLKRIIKINAENNWVADWSNEEQLKYYLYWDYKNKTEDWDKSAVQYTSQIYMSYEAKDYMMSGLVSRKDFKKFLFIYE